MTKNIAFIIPGFNEASTLPQYTALAKVFRMKGYTPVIVHIDWKRKTMSDYVDQFKRIRAQHHAPCVILGFSFGAMIAALSAGQVRPQMLFLCSLSPYFREDLKRIPITWHKTLGKKRMEDFRQHSFADVGKTIVCRTHLFLGDTEATLYPSLKKRTLEAANTIDRATLTLIESVRHDLGQREYLQCVTNTVADTL